MKRPSSGLRKRFFFSQSNTSASSVSGPKNLNLNQSSHGIKYVKYAV
jgi:hypothetical protein